MKRNNYVARSAFSAARAHPVLIMLLFLSVVCSVAFALISPLVLEKVVDSLASGYISAGLAVLYFAFLSAGGISDAAKEVTVTIYGQKITRMLREKICAKLSRLSAKSITEKDPGVITACAVNDVDAVDSLFSSGIIGMFADICRTVGILAVIFIKAPGLGILMILLLPAVYSLTRYFRRTMKKAQSENRSAVANAVAFIPETLRNMRMIRVTGKEKYMAKTYDGYVKKSYDAVERANFCDSLYSPVVNIISAAVIAFIMAASASGGAMAELFGMNVGAVAAIIAYVGKIFGPIESIGMEIQNIQSAAAGSDRINAFLSENEREQTDLSLKYTNILKNRCPRVEICDVTFGYSGNAHVLENFSLTVSDGENVTLTGRTGAGKSTVLKLILGLYVPESGYVNVCGIRADKIPDTEKRHIFGYVEQAYSSIPGSVKDQITLCDPSITDEDVIRSLKNVGLYDTVSSMSDGIYTEYSDNLFSQGQRRLLGIARATSADPQILLLDEITSNLDAETEKNVLSALRGASQNRTVISVSHRLFNITESRQKEV